MSRIRLRARVVWLTIAFGCALLLITFVLTLQAKRSQERWSRLISVETESIARLEEFIRTQNAFLNRLRKGDDYTKVEQLLELDALKSIDRSTLVERVRSFHLLLDSGAQPAALQQESKRVVVEAQRLIDLHKTEISRQLPMLERDANGLMLTGISTAWIVVILSLAVAITTMRRVVRPVENLAAAADRIAGGDADARAPIGGDLEIVKLGVAFNRMADELNSRARTDDLTSLPNFRAFRERIDAEIARTARYRERFGILVLDLDKFKNYNDKFGHLAGNDALQRVSEVIRETVRAVDFPARYGGEEFAIIVPLADSGALARLAERIRAKIEALPAPANGGQLTISIGAAIQPEDGATAEALFQKADERLYDAKRLGRNRVVVGITPPRVVQSGG